MGALEAIAAIAVVINIVLIGRRTVWNFPFGLFASAVYFFIFWDIRLYSGALLQLFFIGLQLWGWVNWSRARRTNRAGEIPVTGMSNGARLVWFVATAAACLAWGAGMRALTDANVPFWDAGLSGASIASQALVALRRVEGLVVWVGVNIGAFALFLTQGLYPTAALYVLLLLISLFALRAWARASRGAAEGTS